MTMVTTAASPATSVDDEAATDVRTREAFDALLGRLSQQSVVKHFDAYADIAWDDPDMAVDPVDPRWELPADDLLGGTDWYRNQPQDVRARIGLQRVVDSAKVGLQFENVLKRGLLEFAFKLPNGSPEFRYVYHEVAEETHHGMMFQELVNRSRIDPAGMSSWKRRGSRRVVLLGRRFPELFFLFVLGGEDPIDHVQRRLLKRGHNHPLLERIMRIHVTEEARHLSFARHWLKREVPAMAAPKRFVMSVAAPMLLGQMASSMLRPSKAMVREFAIPRSVLREAYGSAAAKQSVKDSVHKVRRLCTDLGLINPLSKRLWKVVGLWDETA